MLRYDNRRIVFTAFASLLLDGSSDIIICCYLFLLLINRGFKGIAKRPHFLNAKGWRVLLLFHIKYYFISINHGHPKSILIFNQFYSSISVLRSNRTIVYL